jgi:hypothetical protein
MLGAMLICLQSLAFRIGPVQGTGFAPQGANFCSSGVRGGNFIQKEACLPDLAFLQELLSLAHG